MSCRIKFADGNRISYLYDANGTKLRTTHIIGNDTTVTDYCGNLIYENGVAMTLLVEGGYVSLSDRKYHFYLQDHQGNNRVIANENGNIEEVNHYYPFGGTFASSSSSVQAYKYNGKELDRKNGLDWYDYGARHYDAALGRWHVVDPMAEMYYSWSPYVYYVNSPTNYVDPTGCFSTKFGAWLYKLFNGGDQILKDIGGEYFVSTQIEHSGDEIGATVNRRFDWNGRNTGRNLAVEKQWNAYIADIEFQELAERHGMEYIRTNSRSEALANMLQPMSLVIMPTPLLKSGNALVNAGSKASSNTQWIFGGFKSTAKWTSQMNKRGWTVQQITEAISKGKQYKAVNMVNKSNGATRYVHPVTGRSVVVDDVTKELLQVGGDGFLW